MDEPTQDCIKEMIEAIVSGYEQVRPIHPKCKQAIIAAIKWKACQYWMNSALAIYKKSEKRMFEQEHLKRIEKNKKILSCI